MAWRQRSAWLITAGGVALLAWLASAPTPAPLQAGHAPFDLGPRPAPGPRLATRTRELQTFTTGPHESIDAAPKPMSDTLALLWTLGATLLLVGGAAALLISGYLALRRMREEQRVVEATVDALPEVPDVLVREPEVFHAALAGGAPRNAIVACWARLEDAAASAGVPMARHETSSEYTERVVTAWVSDDAALRRLAALYREARFSRHPLDEEARSAAAQALDGLLQDLRRTWEVRRAPVER